MPHKLIVPLGAAMRRVACLIAFLAAFVSAAGLAAASDFEAALGKLTDKSFQVKEQAIAEIAASGDERALPILSALQAGDLYFVRKDKRIVFAEKLDKGFSITDALTGEALGEVKRRAVRKVSINNRLRTALKSAIGSLELFSPDAEARLAAARSMLVAPTADALAMLDRALTAESEASVREALETARAAVQAQTGPLDARLAAVGVMSGSMNQDVWRVLGKLVEEGGETTSEDAQQVALAASAALASIEDQKRFYSFLETLFFGISLGAVLLLAAVGLAITFGVMGVINMAHGEMLMLGAYTTFVVQQLMPNAIEYSLFVAIPAAFIVTGAVGILLERSVIRVLYGRPLETLLATFGVSLILQQAVRTIFSPLNQPVITPDWMSGFYEVNGALSLTYNRLYIIAFSLIVFLALLAVLRKTSLGLQMRAVTQNRKMAASMGIRTGWVDAMTFGLGSGIAGIGGVALSQLTNVGPNLGQAYIIDSFLVVVFGGVGNLWGTLVGAMTLGVVNKFIEPFTGAVIAKILVLVFIILFIQRRPRGLFALKGRAVDN